MASAMLRRGFREWKRRRLMIDTFLLNDSNGGRPAEAAGS